MLLFAEQPNEVFDGFSSGGAGGICTLVQTWYKVSFLHTSRSYPSMLSLNSLYANPTPALDSYRILWKGFAFYLSRWAMLKADPF
jgi:hypothetical protein